MKHKNLTDVLIDYFREEHLYLDVFSVEEAADALAQYLEKHMQPQPWEGRIYKGVFYVKQPDGRYWSDATMKYLTKKQAQA